MKYTSIISATLLFISSLIEAAPLEERSLRLSSHLSSPTYFYRAVTGREMASARSIYPVGHSPQAHATMSGDLSGIGGLYVFSDIDEANTWGNSWCKVDPRGATTWNLVKFQYTPNPRLRTKSFMTDDAAWKTFVNGNYQNERPGPYDIVEAPMSVGHGPRMQGYVNKGQLVWQGAFIGQAGLSALKVVSVTPVKLPSKRRCCDDCNIM